MKVICIKQPKTMIDTEFIVGKIYTCFKKIAHITWLDKDVAYRQPGATKSVPGR